MTIGTRAYSLFEGVRIALDAIRSNKVRAGLTILGIAVGVFVVTVMSAAVHGINDGVSKSIAAAGPTTFFLTRWPPEINSCNGSADSCPWRHSRSSRRRRSSDCRSFTRSSRTSGAPLR
jgi:putative ABC transport system permease protein